MRRSIGTAGRTREIPERDPKVPPETGLSYLRAARIIVSARRSGNAKGRRPQGGVCYTENSFILYATALRVQGETGYVTGAGRQEAEPLGRAGDRMLKEACMPSIGIPELLLILGIVLLIFGPRKLPELGNALGRTIKEFKKGMKEKTSSSPEEKK